MKYLALDIGKRRTGVAFGDTSIGIPLPLSTIHHTNIDRLVKEVQNIVHERAIDEVVIGMPFLPSGSQGSQAQFVERCAEKLKEYAISYSFIDERYTTNATPQKNSDASAACAILETKFMLNKDI